MFFPLLIVHGSMFFLGTWEKFSACDVKTLQDWSEIGHQ